MHWGNKTGALRRFNYDDETPSEFVPGILAAVLCNSLLLFLLKKSFCSAKKHVFSRFSRRLQSHYELFGSIFFLPNLLFVVPVAI